MADVLFKELVNEALESIPARFRDALQNIAIVIEQEPTAGQLESVGLDPAEDTLLGLYEGTPLTERGWAHGNTLPDKITLFQRVIEDQSEDEDDLVVAIGETLIHEIGHYFGLSEEEIEEIEERYWRGEEE
jgi:predicted Zn-dependent protease with MMP-like domain